MPNKLLLAAADNKKLEHFATNNKMSRALVDRYVAGKSLDEARHAAEQLTRKGIDTCLNPLGESVRNVEDCARATQDYLDGIHMLHQHIPHASVSVKPSQLGMMVSPELCTENLRNILVAGREHGVAVEVDMEHSSIHDQTVAMVHELLVDFPDIRMAIQSYSRAAPDVLHSFKAKQLRIRLVKGAFEEDVDTAIQHPKDVTSQYTYQAAWALRNLPDPAFGTHDDRCINFIKAEALQLGLANKDFEFQMLYGIRPELQEQLVQQGYRVRIYLPYGDQWYPYLMRRMAERPANLLLFLRSLVTRS
ncbi:MAG TPA: proline dehydrogenase family protein [Enteractinococcus sp.]